MRNWKWRALDMVVTITAAAVLWWSGGILAVTAAFVWAMWAYADGFLELTHGERCGVKD